MGEMTMPSAFGDTDYTGLNRVKSALDVATGALMRNQMAEINKQKDVANQGVAQQAWDVFQAKTQPRQTAQASSAPATGLSAGIKSANPVGTDPTARVEGNQTEVTDAEYLRAAADANAILSTSRGPHTEAAAKRLNDLVEARVKFKALGGSGGAGNRPRHFFDTSESPDPKKWPLLKRIGNNIHRLQVEKYTDTNQPTGEFNYAAGGAVPQGREGLGAKEQQYIDKLEAKKKGLEERILGKHPSINMDEILAQKANLPIEPGTEKSGDAIPVKDANGKWTLQPGASGGGVPDKDVQSWLATIGEVENFYKQKDVPFTPARELARAKLNISDSPAAPGPKKPVRVSLKAARAKYERQSPGSTRNMSDAAMKDHLSKAGFDVSE
jgi:hypothetical protein